MDERKKKPAQKSRRRLYEEPSKESGKSSAAAKKPASKKPAATKTVSKKAAPKKVEPKTTKPKIATKSAKKSSTSTKTVKLEKHMKVVPEIVEMESDAPLETKTKKVEIHPETINPEGVEREQKVNLLIKKYVKWSAGLSLIPIPLIDLASLVTAQTSMIAELASIYDVPFQKELRKNLYSVIVSGLFAHSVSNLHWVSMTKLIPGFGLFWNVVSYPIAAAATTYAVGKVFAKHFESGGTILDFDPKKMKPYFKSNLNDGIKVAKSS
jgi:uncharacterized protein (DUF697 family)